MKRYIALSVIAHTLLIAFTLYRPAVQSASKQPGPGGEFPEAPQKREIIEVSIVDEPSEAESDCPYFFGGIGVGLEPFDGSVVSNVYSGYPAERAGIQRGDRLQVLNGPDIEGEIGTTVIIQVTRDLTVFTVRITRGKICIER